MSNLRPTFQRYGAALLAGKRFRAIKINILPPLPGGYLSLPQTLPRISRQARFVTLIEKMRSTSSIILPNLPNTVYRHLPAETIRGSSPPRNNQCRPADTTFFIVSHKRHRNVFADQGSVAGVNKRPVTGLSCSYTPVPLHGDKTKQHARFALRVEVPSAATCRCKT